MKRFKDKVVLVTGSTSGIGFAIAKKFGLEGAKVVVTSRKVSNVNNAVQKLTKLGINCCGKTCHAGKENDIIELIKFIKIKYNLIDYLIANAGRTSATFHKFINTTNKEFDSIFNTNIRGPFWLVKYSLPLLLKSNTPSIVLLSSIASYSLTNLSGPYPISKAGVNAMTKILNKELGPLGIRVNCLAPGVIPTNMSQFIVKNKALRNNVLKETTINKLGSVSQMASIVAFLCSSDSSYISGEIIVGSGGMRSRL